jgi:segregation and condensation protein A
MLLPTPEQDEAEHPGEDPRAELVAHLLEYKRYKEAAADLGARPVLDRDVFARDDPEAGVDVSPESRPLEVSLRDLILAFRDVLARTARRDLLEIEPDRLSIRDKIHEILSRLKEAECITFQSLFAPEVDRRDLLVTFLALLEIVKLRLVRVHQDRPFGTILVTRRVPLDSDPSPAPDVLDFI